PVIARTKQSLAIGEDRQSQLSQDSGFAIAESARDGPVATDIKFHQRAATRAILLRGGGAARRRHLGEKACVVGIDQLPVKRQIVRAIYKSGDVNARDICRRIREIAASIES